MSRPLSRWLPRAVTVGVATLLLVVGAGGPTRPADAQDPESTEVTLRLESQTSWVGPEGAFQVAFTTDQLPAGAEVRVEVHARARSRETLDAAAAGEVRGDPIFRGSVQPVAEVTTAGAPAVVSLPVTMGPPSSAPAGTASITIPGVYPTAVVIRSSDGDVLAQLVTTMVRLAPAVVDNASAPLTVGVVVPIQADAVPGLDGTPTLDDLAAATLIETIEAVTTPPAVPLTLAPSPESVQLLAARDAEGRAAVELLTARVDRQTLSDPFAPIDTGSWMDSGLVAQLDDQYRQGTLTLQTTLGSRPSERLAVLDRTVTPEALAHLQDRGVDAVVAPSGQLAPLTSEVRNAAFAEQFQIPTGDDRSVRAVVADDAAGNRLGSDGDPVLAAHQALAELAYLGGQVPSTQSGRGVAVIVPEEVDPVTLRTFLAGLADRTGAASGSSGSPVVSPLTLDGLVATTDPAASGSSAPILRDYSADPPGDLGDYPGDLRRAEDSLDGLRALLPTASALTEPIARTLLSSGARSLDPDQRAAMVGSVTRTIEATTAEIVVAPEQIVTLTSSSGNVPLNLENRLQYPAEVRIELTSAKLDFPDGSVIRQTLPAAQTTTINLSVETRASGAFPLTVVISSADDAIPVATTRYTVRSTAISGVGLVLSIGAGVFLLAWWARHFRTSRRARKLVASNHPAVSGGEPAGYAPPQSDPGEGR